MSDVMSFRERALQSNDAIELLANKWRITILHILREGPLRTREIQTAIPEVSPKMLTQALRGMERDGLLVREVHTTGTRHVEYCLTPMGNSLIPPLQELCRWAKANVRGRDQARERFDHLQNMKT
jgi:DNA-binding HxlR family transcriptional regulator